MNKDIVFLSGKRTPFGAYCGGLTRVSANDLGVVAAKAALEQAGIEATAVDHVIFGNVMQTSPDAIYCGRHIGLKTGVPEGVGGLTVNRLCGSGFQALIDAARMLLLDEAEIVLAGGTENMSQAPHTVRGARTGIPLFQSPMADYIAECLHDSFAGIPMAITAENLATKFEIARADADDYAFSSQARYAAAKARGFFASELTPVEIAGRRGTAVIDADEHPRETTPEKLASLRAVFKKDGIVTAGNASGICDGAAAMVMSTRAAADAAGVAPIGRLVGWGIAGCDPKIMGIGPVYAAQRALASTGMTLADMDLVEVNEAFAPQYIAVERQLGLDRDKTNVNGGAIAVGHPLAASGTRITQTLLYALKDKGLRYGLGSACIGGGQGIAVIVEAL